MRERGLELRRALEQANAAAAMPAGAAALRVTAYVGQRVIEEENGDHG